MYYTDCSNVHQPQVAIFYSVNVFIQSLGDNINIPVAKSRENRVKFFNNFLIRRKYISELHPRKTFSPRHDRVIRSVLNWLVSPEKICELLKYLLD